MCTILFAYLKEREKALREREEAVTKKEQYLEVNNVCVWEGGVYSYSMYCKIINIGWQFKLADSTNKK